MRQIPFRRGGGGGAKSLRLAAAGALFAAIASVKTSSKCVGRGFIVRRLEALGGEGSREAVSVKAAGFAMARGVCEAGFVCKYLY